MFVVIGEWGVEVYESEETETVETMEGAEEQGAEKVESAEGAEEQGEPEKSEPHNAPVSVTLVASVAPVDEASHTRRGAQAERRSGGKS